MAWDQALLPQEFPSMGQAVRFLAYHTEELEEVQIRSYETAMEI